VGKKDPETIHNDSPPQGDSLQWQKEVSKDWEKAKGKSRPARLRLYVCGGVRTGLTWPQYQGRDLLKKET